MFIVYVEFVEKDRTKSPTSVERSGFFILSGIMVTSTIKPIKIKRIKIKGIGLGGYSLMEERRHTWRRCGEEKG